jgi:nicotinamidase-related amidase
MRATEPFWLEGLTDWPVPYFGRPLDVSASALLIIDMQRYWTSEEGPFARMLVDRYPKAAGYLYERLKEVVIPALSHLIAHYRVRELPVIYVTTGAMRPDCADFIPHMRRRVTEGGERAAAFGSLQVGGPWHTIDDRLKPRPGELILNKTSRSAFTTTGIDQILRNMGHRHLVFGGIATNACVDLTARDAADRGFEAFLVEDGCATMSEDAHAPCVRDFCRLFGSVMQAADVVGRAVVGS